jgi:hypothetical protein
MMPRAGMNAANFEVVRSDNSVVVIRDLGPWTKHPTVTNDAEQVVAGLGSWLNGRRLLYYDSEGELGELKHEGTRFTGFAPVKSEGTPGKEAPKRRCIMA